MVVSENVVDSGLSAPDSIVRHSASVTERLTAVKNLLLNGIIGKFSRKASGKSFSAESLIVRPPVVKTSSHYSSFATVEEFVEWIRTDASRNLWRLAHPDWRRALSAFRVSLFLILGRRSMLRFVIATAVLGFCATSFGDDAADGWKSLFDGQTFGGWQKSENKDSWKVVDGTLRCDGKRSHLFYVGDDKPFKNFEFECEVMTAPGSNAGIYFHTKVQEEGLPKYGYECQVNITHGDPKKTGSLYGVVNTSEEDLKGLVKDNEWYKTSIKVEGRHITIRINDQVTVDYTEPEGQAALDDKFERRLGEGTFALQAHDPKSVVSFRNLKVRRLP
jgi:hypothetical protein